MTTKSGRRDPLPYRRGTRATVALGLVAAVSIGASACGSSSPVGGSGTITVYTYGDNYTVLQQTAVDAFNKTSAVKVKLVQVPGSEYSAGLSSVMASTNAPDVFFNWGGGSIEPYVKAGELVDLTPYFEKTPLKGAFLPSVVAAGAVDGKDYGVPMRGMQPVILFYNKALFARYHLQPPNTWAAMQTAITAFEAHQVIPFALGGADNWPDLMWLEYLLDRVGGSGEFTRIEDGDSAGWADQAMTTALDDIRSLIQEGAFGTDFTTTSYTGNAAPALLGSGKAAMQLMGSWDYANQLTNFPDFAKNMEGFTTFPAVPGGVGNPADVVGNPTNFWSVNAKTAHLSTAISFVQLMTSQTYTKSLLGGGWIPTATDTASLLPSYPNPVFGQFQYQMVQRAPSFQLSWDQALPASVGTPLDTEIGKFFAGQVSVATFEADMRAEQNHAGS